MDRYLRRCPIAVVALISALWLGACTTPAVPPTATAVPPTVEAMPGSATATPIRPTVPLPPTARPTATADTGQPVDTTATQQAVLDAIWAELKPRYPETALLVGITGFSGDYAAAQASPVGERPLFVYVQSVAGAWQVIQATSIPSAGVLEELGVPEELTLATDVTAVVDVAAAYVSDNFGGIDAYLSYPQLREGYARIEIVPAAGFDREPTIMFMQQDEEAWRHLADGTAFTEEEMDELGIPADLWQDDIALRGPA